MLIGGRKKNPLGSLRTIPPDHAAIHFELDLLALVDLTQDIELFDSCGILPHVQQFIDRNNFKHKPGFVEWDYNCIVPYDHVPNPTFPWVGRCQKSYLSYSRVGKKIVWSYDFYKTGNYEEITEIFAWGATGKTCNARSLCYNVNCIKRNHWIGETKKQFHKRYFCSGPPECIHLPQCLIWGPAYNEHHLFADLIVVAENKRRVSFKEDL